MKDIYNLWGLIELIETLQDMHENEPDNILNFERMRKELLKK
ncbi:MAG: hypothetical protein AB1480_09980 [Nitrospirota bacterium]